MICDGAFNHERLIALLQVPVREGKHGRKKVSRVLDNRGVHHCKTVKAWLSEHGCDVEAFFPPGYGPELEADERLDADLAQAIGSKVPVRAKTKLRAAAAEHRQSVAAGRDRVGDYFRDPSVK